jgi:hypothetical protein
LCSSHRLDIVFRICARMWLLSRSVAETGSSGVDYCL